MKNTKPKKQPLMVATGAAKAVRELKGMRFPTKPRQSEAFIQARPAALQYFIDVLALAFVLAIILTLLAGTWK